MPADRDDKGRTAIPTAIVASDDRKDRALVPARPALSTAGAMAAPSSRAGR